MYLDLFCKSCNCSLDIYDSFRARIVSSKSIGYRSSYCDRVDISNQYESYKDCMCTVRVFYCLLCGNEIGYTLIMPCLKCQPEDPDLVQNCLPVYVFYTHMVKRRRRVCYDIAR